jgi:hypothetical protein
MPFPKLMEVSIERGYELAEELSDKTNHEGRTLTVFSGRHPELGPIHILIPPLGDALLLPAELPVATQKLSL